MDAIQTVAGGGGEGGMFPDDRVRQVFRLICGGTAMMPNPRVLTAREREVIVHFARGKSYAGVAKDLGIGTVSVRNTIYRVQAKLGVESN